MTKGKPSNILNCLKNINEYNQKLFHYMREIEEKITELKYSQEIKYIINIFYFNNKIL